MAISSLFTLIDDVASILDDVALMTKMAAKKTAGVVGDDLALNANQVTGVNADRELPVVWAVAKGSLLNKIILIPIALLLAQFAPFLVVPLLLIGGAYLCFEGVEKLLHKYLARHSTTQAMHTLDNLVSEQAKVKGAIRTDFILSAEIIIIALGEVHNTSLMTQIIVLSLIGIGMTIAVYGLVALIVKADDFGLFLLTQTGRLQRLLGRIIINMMPWFMRLLSVAGTLAMFLVGGGIFTHNITWFEQLHVDNFWVNNGLNLLIGAIVGLIACLIVLPIAKKFNAR